MQQLHKQTDGLRRTARYRMVLVYISLYTGIVHSLKSCENYFF